MKPKSRYNKCKMHRSTLIEDLLAQVMEKLQKHDILNEKKIKGEAVMMYEFIMFNLCSFLFIRRPNLFCSCLVLNFFNVYITLKKNS